MTVAFVTSVQDFTRDLLALIDDQIKLARTDPAFHQRATVIECAHAISCLRLRLRHHEYEQALAMLVEPFYNTTWLTEWDDLANTTSPSAATFLSKASELAEGVGKLREVFGPLGRPLPLD